LEEEVPLTWTLFVVVPSIGAMLLVAYRVIRRVDRSLNDEEARRRSVGIWPLPHSRF
jgi:hypothetical protein